MGKYSLVNIDLRGRGKPTEKLVETVSAAVGILYEPTRVVRQAKAEAKAEVKAARIRLRGAAKNEELAHRAAKRIADRDMRRQENIESVVVQALDELPETVDDTPVDEDWVHTFFGHVEDVGNERMQSLWARLLAGEVTHPGSFSVRTLALVRNLEPADADLFTKYCRHVWKFNRQRSGSIYTKASRTHAGASLGIHEPQLLHLESCGLISRSVFLGIDLHKESPQDAAYGSEIYRFQPQSEAMPEVRLPIDMLTESGLQLYPIAGAESDPAYIECLMRSLPEEQAIRMERIHPSE